MVNVLRKRTTYFGLLLASIALLSSCNYLSRYEQQKAQPTVSVAAKTIFSFLGAPGAGKGTLSEQCVKYLGFKTISTGNLCREEIASGSAKGKMIAKSSKTGGLVPDEVIAEMVEQWLSKQTGDTPIILDGYPRTQKQAKMFAGLLKNKFADYHLRIISLQMDNEEEIVKRIANRFICENKKCQAVYNRALMKDPTKLVCEKCGGKLIQREDDKEEAVRRRLKDFAKNNAEIIAFYTQAGIPVESLNVSHSTPELTFDKFRKLIHA